MKVQGFCFKEGGREGGREVDIKIDLEEIGCESVHWIHLAQDRNQLEALVNMVINLQVP
jgi:hypothetical protein